MNVLFWLVTPVTFWVLYRLFVKGVRLERQVTELIRREALQSAVYGEANSHADLPSAGILPLRAADLSETKEVPFEDQGHIAA